MDSSLYSCPNSEGDRRNDPSNSQLQLSLSFLVVTAIQTNLPNALPALTYPIFCATLLLMWSYYPEIPFKFMYTIFYVIPRSVFHGFLDVLGLSAEGTGRGKSCIWFAFPIDVDVGSFAAGTLPPTYQSNPNYGGYAPSNSFFQTYRTYGAVNDLEINWMSVADSEENRGAFMMTLSYVLFICAAVVLYDGFKARF